MKTNVTSGKWQVTSNGAMANRVTRHASRVTGFTMVEIAICLAIIGIALVAIIGVLPLGINVQKDNRQETIVNQDATVFMENIRNGARGLDDLTNYVYAIANTTTGQGYTNGLAGQMGFNPAIVFPGVKNWSLFLTNGMNIVGLLSTPEYTTNMGTPSYPVPISSLIFGGTSNHIVACVRSLSGPAVQQPPQTNDVIIGGSFGYKMICDNLPVAHYMPPRWTGGRYQAGAEVSYPLNGQVTYWQATNGNLGEEPSLSPVWVRVLYPQELDQNSHQLRLTFLWPLLPNGKVGNGRHAFATTVAGQILQTNFYGYSLYFFQPQTFTTAP